MAWHWTIFGTFIWKLCRQYLWSLDIKNMYSPILKNCKSSCKSTNCQNLPSFFCQKCSKSHQIQIEDVYFSSWHRHSYINNVIIKRNGILLLKLFLLTVRKILLKFEAEGNFFEITRTIYSSSERSEKFLVTECCLKLVPWGSSYLRI